MSKKDYVIENITDAFLALNEIDDDEVIGMVRNVRKTKRVNEGKSFSVSNINSMELEEAENFLHKNNDTEIEVIDADADSIEHIKDKEAYVGQAILQCNKCKEKRFMDMDKLVTDPDDDTLYNTEDMCPHCKDVGSGYELLGQVGKVEKEEPEPEIPTDSLTTEPDEELPPVDNDEASEEEVTFENDLEPEAEDTTTEDALVQEPENLPEPEEKKLKLKLHKNEEDNGMETTASEDDDLLDLPDLGEEYKEKFGNQEDNDREVSEAFFKEAEGNNEYAHEAWMMNQVIESMNNEEAYYNGWLYVWPDGETREECEYDFSDRDSFEDLKDTFIDTYRYYHDDGLYNADEETEAYAHKWDDILELDSIENIMPKRVESLDEADEEVSEEEIEEKPFSVDDLFKFMIDPEKMEDVTINGYEGTYEDAPTEIFDLNLESFNVGDGNLVINVSEPVDDEDVVTVEKVLSFFNDEENENVSLVDAEDFEELVSGTKEELLGKYSDYKVESIEKPVHLEVIGVDEVEEVEEEPVDENLFEQICRENNLHSYKANRYNTEEYWLKENLESGENLEEVYNTYCEGKESAIKFKEQFGYKDDADILYDIKEELIRSNNCACVYGYKYNNRPLFLESVLYANTESQLQNLLDNVSYKYNTNNILVTYNPVNEGYVIKSRKGYYNSVNHDLVTDSSFATIYVNEELANEELHNAKEYFNEDLVVATMSLDNILVEGMTSAEPFVKKEVLVEEVVQEATSNESFNNDQFTEFMDLSDKLGIKTQGDLMDFSKAHGNVKDLDLLNAMRKEASNSNKVVEESFIDNLPTYDPLEEWEQEVKENANENLDEGKGVNKPSIDNRIKNCLTGINESIQSFKTRKELTEAIKEYQKNNKPYIVKRSVKEGYRFDLCEMLAPENDVVVVEQPEEVEGEVIDTPFESNNLPELSLNQIEVITNITRVANDICNAVEKYYNIETNPALVVADILQDLRLVSGDLDVNDLEDTPINNLTREMFNDYQAGYQMVDAIMSELTGEQFVTTPRQKLAQAIRALNGPAFSTEVIEQGIASDRFITAVQHGQIPFIPEDTIPQLTEDTPEVSDDTVFFWELKDVDEALVKNCPLNVNVDLGNFGGENNNVDVLGEEKADEALIKDSPVNINIDAHEFGGAGNNVSVLSPSLSEEVDENDDERALSVDCYWERNEDIDYANDFLEKLLPEEFEYKDIIIYVPDGKTFLGYYGSIPCYEDDYREVKIDWTYKIDWDIASDIAFDFIDKKFPKKFTLKDLKSIDKDELCAYVKEQLEERAQKDAQEYYDLGGFDSDDYYESVEVDTDLFDKEINEYFDRTYNETFIYTTQDGHINDKGEIILEGMLDAGEREKKVTFTFTPMNSLNESFETAADVAKVLGVTNYKVTNDLSEEVFEFKFVNDTKNEEIFKMKDEEKLEIINKFMKSCPDCKKYLNSREMIKAAAEWAFNENPAYKKLGLDACHIENFLISVMDQIDMEKLIENGEPEEK